MSPDVTREVYLDADALAYAAAVHLLKIARAAVAERGEFRLALSGGSTPKKLYSLLADDSAFTAFPWTQTHFFFGDERPVPPDHPESNFLMASATLFRKGQVPAKNIHRIQGELADPAEAATRYETELKAFFAGQSWPEFDLVLLGMGPDGHTASLFPGSPGLQEKEKWFMANWVEKFQTHRLTLTFPALNAAREIYLLVAGADKTAMVEEVLVTRAGESFYPVQQLTPRKKVWLLDTAAAAELPA